MDDKLDVVISFYQRPHYWPQVFRGLQDNEAQINRVIVVNDELWTPATLAKMHEASWSGPYSFLEHEHAGFGSPVSINQGFEAATTRYVVHIDDDIVLGPHALEKMLPGLRPKVLLYGRLHGRDPDTGEQTYTDDSYPSKIAGEPHLIARHGFFIADREAHNFLGGVNEEFDVYGYEEYEYCLRWLLEYGPASIGVGPGEGFHIGIDILPQDKTRRAKVGSKNWCLLQEAYQKFLAAYPQTGFKVTRG